MFSASLSRFFSIIFKTTEQKLKEIDRDLATYESLLKLPESERNPRLCNADLRSRMRKLEDERTRYA